MTANFAYSVRPARQSDCSISDLAERGRREHVDGTDGGNDICASSNERLDRRSSIQAVDTLHRSPLFAQLSHENIARLNARCLWRMVRAGSLFKDDSADGCALSVVTNGRVRAVRMINGREVILRDIEEGEYFGELSAIDGRPAPAQIVAISDAIVARMPSKIFREAVDEYPSVRNRVLTDLATLVRSMNDRFSEQISLNTRERLSVELLRLSRRTAKDRIAVSPPPSHAEFAARIGGCRETVTKLLNAFERDGLISRSRSAIVLIDVPRLRAIAAPGADSVWWRAPSASCRLSARR